MYPDELLEDDSDKEDEDTVEAKREKNWDRFEANEKEFSKIGKSGYREDNGIILTKHDENLSGRKNAGKIMELNDFASGDCGNFDMKVSNKVFNELRTHSNQMAKKNNQAHLDRKMDIKTNEMGVDVNTRLILYKLINTSCILDYIDGIISTGKEAVILHGETNQNNPDHRNLPKEVAIKIFSTTLNEFKQRDRYIKDDYRFKGSSKQNSKNIIRMWCEKELHNLTRLKKAGIPCPEVVVMKKHILVMSFIGDGYDNPAPKLKDAILTEAELIYAYIEVTNIMKTMYRDAKLVHADLSEYNILWYMGRCVVIDLAQAVEPLHPAALEFLMRDCDNITSFFAKSGVPVKTKEELFFEITQLDPLTTNTTMLERIHMKGEADHVVTRPQNLDDEEREKVPEKYRLKEFPFDYAWQKVEELKGNTNIIKVELEEDAMEKSKEEEWVEVKALTKKKSKRNSESKTIIDNDVADGLKEISFGTVPAPQVEKAKAKTNFIKVELEKSPEEWVDVNSQDSAVKTKSKRKSGAIKKIVDNEIADVLKEISVSIDPATGTVLEQTLIEGDYVHVAARPQETQEFSENKLDKLEGKTHLIEIELEETGKEKEEWVEVKSSAKKRNKRKSESKTIVDHDIADGLKEISVSITKK